MAVLTKTFLLGTSSDGFTQSGYTDWDSISCSSGLMVAYKITTSGNTSYSGTLIQGTTTNTYEDFGVPAGANILGIQFQDMNSSVVQDANAFMVANDASFWTNEASLGTFTIGGAATGTYQDLISYNLVASDYMRLQVDIFGEVGTDFSPDPIYGSLEFQIYSFTIDITYEIPRKNKMFFAL